MNARHFLQALPVLSGVLLFADPVPVRRIEGRIHGFIELRDANDRVIAAGNVSQMPAGTRVTSELDFRFKDGSVHQETAVFAQRRVFQLLNYHLVQKGPSFKNPQDVSLNASSGQVAIRYTHEDGKEEVINDRIKVPPDLANGMLSLLLANLDFKAPKSTLSFLVATPKPRIVKLEIMPEGEDSFTVSGIPGKAQRFVVKVDIGGLAGLIAPVVGKQPPDTRVWIVGGKAPGFLRLDGPLFQGGPIWRIQLASPVWPR